MILIFEINIQRLECILQELVVEIGKLEKQKDELEDRLKKGLFCFQTPLEYLNYSAKKHLIELRNYIFLFCCIHLITVYSLWTQI